MFCAFVFKKTQKHARFHVFSPFSASFYPPTPLQVKVYRYQCMDKCSGVQTHISPCVLPRSAARSDSRSAASSWPSCATLGEGGGGGDDGDGVRSVRDGRGAHGGGAYS